MLKYGHIVKLTKERRLTGIGSYYVNVIKQWKTNYKYILVKDKRASKWNDTSHTYEKYTEEYFHFILPRGTVGILLKIIVDKGHEEYLVGFPNPVAGTIFSSSLSLGADDFTIDVTPKEKEPIIKSHAKYITSRVHDNLEAIKRISEAQHYDIRKKLDEQNTELG